MSIKTKSPLVNFYHSRENEWSSFVEKNIPNAVLMRWSSEHRVFLYGNRIFKVEKTTFGLSRDFQKSIEYEYKVLISSKMLIKDYSPKYYVIDGLWDVLEIDFIEGIFLEDWYKKSKIQMSMVFKIAFKLFSISLSGIFYKQLRARHIIVTENNKIFFIDFGHSFKVNFLLALIQNFSPIRYVSSKWEEGRFVGIVMRIIKMKISNINNPLNDEVESANQRWKVNQSRHSHSLPKHLKSKFNDDIAVKNFLLMEEKIFESISHNPKIAADAIEFNFDTYGVAAHRDWGFIWDAIRRKINFEKKVVIDIGSGMGGVGAFSRMEGAKLVVSYDEEALLLDASRFFSQALGFNDNIYHLCPLSQIKTLPEADIVFFISSRFDSSQKVDFLNLIADYPEVVFLSQSKIDLSSQLIKRGFNSVNFLAKVDSKCSIFYAAK